jgi:hypothetical protein
MFVLAIALNFHLPMHAGKSEFVPVADCQSKALSTTFGRRFGAS